MAAVDHAGVARHASRVSHPRVSHSPRVSVDKVGEVGVAAETQPVHDDDKVFPEAFAQEKIDERVEGCG